MANINFKGKEIVRNHHLTIPYHELVPDTKKGLSKKPSLNDNLIIHGDNLLALKALLPTYAGKVKCIYIDPPYNTGNEKWAYNDNVNSPMMKEWLGKVVDKDDLTRHDKWLCMMMPRLKLLRELLSEDGVIFISIDDNETHRLRALVDEVFDGDGNFIGTLIWQRAKGGGNAKDVVRGHDYVLVYKKSTEAEIALTQKGDKSTFHFGRYKECPENYVVKNNVLYFINDDVVRKVFGKYEKGTERRCEYEDITRIKGAEFKKEVDKKMKSGEFILKKNKNGKHFVCRLELVGDMRQKLYTIISGFLSEVGKNELAELGLADTFDYPKPVGLVKTLIDSYCEKDDLILDSFAGSGTTAHAVLGLNKKDGGKRKFILVQLPEEIEKDRPAYKLGFREVADITAERVRRVIKGIKGAKDEGLRKGLGGSFSYFELGKPIDTERILKGKDLPTFAEMARYIFYTATGEEFNEKKVNEKTGFIGESKEYEVYLLYKPDMEYLKSTAFTLERAETLGKFTGKKRLVFAPAKYLDQEYLERYYIDFAQLPFEIYQKAK